MSEVFQTLANVDVGEQVEQKGRFDYLSWPWAWSYVKSKYPTARSKSTSSVTIRTTRYLSCVTPRVIHVAVTVTIEGIAHTEIHYVMDHKNKSIVHPDGGEVNKALQRCLVKAIAFHGLGLNIYAGEDLPVMDVEETIKANKSNVDTIVASFKAAENVEQIDTAWKPTLPHTLTCLRKTRRAS